MRLLAGTALMLLMVAAGCSSKKSRPENELLSNDFESLDGWGIDSPSLTQEKAHSGRYSIKAQRGIDFSLTYKNVLERLSPVKPNKLLVTAYVYVTQPTTAALTVQLMRSATDATSIFDKSLSLGSEVKTAGEWKKVSLSVELPANADKTNQLRIYIWGTSADEIVYLDDMQVTKE